MTDTRTRRQLGDWRKARAAGRCDQCKTTYERGEPIRDAAGVGVVAECCGEDED